MAGLQVLQGGVCDQGAVVQFDHLQAVVSAGAAAEMPDAVIGDELTVRQALQEHRSSSITRVLVLLNATLYVYVGDKHSPELANGGSG